MVKIKKKLTTNKTIAKKVTKHKKHIIIIISIVLFVLTLVTLVQFFNAKKSLSTNLNNASNLTNLPLSITTPEAKFLGELKLYENESSVNNYTKKFLEIYLFLLSKLHDKDSKDFHKAVEEYAQGFSKLAFDQYETMCRYFDRIKTYELQTEEIKESNLKIEETNYNKVLFEFAGMLYTSYKELKHKEDYTIKRENAHFIFSSNEGLFVYQQLHLQSILKNMVKIIEVYKFYIYNKLDTYLKSNVFIQLTQLLYSQLNVIKEKMFKPFNGKIGLIYNEENPTIENLMASFDIYDKFIKINLYLVFMHLFRVSINYDVTNVNSYFIRHFLKVYSTDSDEIIKNQENMIMNDCKGVFFLVLLIGDGTGYFNMKNEPFEICCACVFEKRCEKKTYHLD